MATWDDFACGGVVAPRQKLRARERFEPEMQREVKGYTTQATQRERLCELVWVCEARERNTFRAEGTEDEL